MVSLLKQKISLQRFRQLALKPKQICCILEEREWTNIRYQYLRPTPFRHQRYPCPPPKELSLPVLTTMSTTQPLTPCMETGIFTVIKIPATMTKADTRRRDKLRKEKRNKANPANKKRDESAVKPFLVCILTERTRTMPKQKRLLDQTSQRRINPCEVGLHNWFNETAWDTHLLNSRVLAWNWKWLDTRLRQLHNLPSQCRAQKQTQDRRSYHSLTSVYELLERSWWAKTNYNEWEWLQWPLHWNQSLLAKNQQPQQAW